ncbi:MAG TPA: hypothetical protein VMT31_00355 [Methanomicrobiales archaeon]|jgi:hypothetical protein|nr:hypothetical protein [Methanomicrobiales archaeon]
MTLRLEIPLFFAFILGAGMILAGCVILVPVPVRMPAPVPVTPPETTPEACPALLLQTGTPTPGSVTPTEAGTPEPVATFSFANPLPRSTTFTYADNMDFHSLSVSVDGSQMTTGFSYSRQGSPARYEASPGNKFLMIAVDFHMIGILQEGKSSTFMTPLATSFRLVKGGDSYGVLNASEIEGMTDYFIRNVGSMYRDRFITKDDGGSGVVIFEVPGSFDPAGAFVTFCPQNLGSWADSEYYRSPDNWNCERDLVVWQLR